ncbi:MAG TPA: diguanylate cyclase [Acidimicrobiales bacterium]|nr:diguanylate cyclase [Acidimicrobiales bacterium]
MRGRVLVVDDDPIIRGLVVGQLANDGHDVLEASDGRAALDQLRIEPLDVVLLDIEMPDLDGFAVLRALADDERFGEIPIIVLTARDAADDAVRALELGATDFLRKPVQAAELAARVRTSLRIARVQQDLRACRAELQEVTRADQLTGLANRRHIDEHLSMAMSAARRHNHPMSCLVVDIDHFRRLNDTEGHAAGDEVLRVAASRLSHVLRGEDMAGRWGGEEFLVVAPNTDLDGAWRLGERIREAIGGTPIPLSAGRDVLVTVSIGCATGRGDDIDRQLRLAEQALAQAKEAGRNKVVATDPYR